MRSALMTLAAVPSDQAFQPLVMPTSVAALTFGCILGNARSELLQEKSTLKWLERQGRLGRSATICGRATAIYR